jgi:hypothetical protein
MRLPTFHSDVATENYSPQVERLLAEWDKDHPTGRKGVMPCRPSTLRVYSGNGKES